MKTASPRGFSAKEIVLAVALILAGGAALIYAKLQQIHRSTEDQTVLCVVRQLSAAADQFYLENGVSTVELRQLIGATNYIKAIQTVAGETYPLRFTRGLTITVTGVAGSRTVTYAP